MIDQGELFEIPSPCKRICELNNRGYCKGCFRSRNERLHWLQYTDFQRQMIINLCEKRRLKVLEARQQPSLPEEETAPPQFDLFAAPVAEVPVPDDEVFPDLPLPEQADAVPATVSAPQTSLFESAESAATISSPATESHPTADGKDASPDEATPPVKKAASRPRTAPAKGKDDQLDMFS